MSDNDGTTIPIIKYSLLQPPKPEWQWSLADSDNVVFHVVVAPSRFHRFMQLKLLGIKWSKI